MASVERKLSLATDCCVPLCNEDSRQDIFIVFHRFPKDLTAINREKAVNRNNKERLKGRTSRYSVKVNKYERLHASIKVLDL